MPTFFVRQPNGLLAEFSTVVDCFVAFDMTEAEAYHYASRKMGDAEAAAKVKRGLDDVDLEDYTKPHECPLPFAGKGLGRWHGCLDTILTIHGWERLRETLDEICPRTADAPKRR